MISNFPSLFIALRYLKPSKNNTMVSIISLFSFLGIVLGVGTLIIVMSVMNGFKIELLDKIIGINGHLNIHFYNKDFNESQFENFLTPSLILSLSNTLTLLNLTPRLVKICTVAAEKPHIGKAGLPFIYSTTLLVLISLIISLFTLFKFILINAPILFLQGCTSIKLYIVRMLGVRK